MAARANVPASLRYIFWLKEVVAVAGLPVGSAVGLASMVGALRRADGPSGTLSARLAWGTAGNAVVERALQKVRKSLEEGKSLTEPLKESEVFPGMVTQMISVGEQTGAMDAMLQKIADFYEEEVDAAVKDLLTALEPIMIVFLGVVVGGVVISMYMPLFSLIGKLSGK